MTIAFNSIGIFKNYVVCFVCFQYLLPVFILSFIKLLKIFKFVLWPAKVDPGIAFKDGNVVGRISKFLHGCECLSVDSQMNACKTT